MNGLLNSSAISWFALAARCLLSVVFFAAGLSKLLDLKGSRKAITDFGLPGWSANPLGTGLPIAEIIIAFLLLITSDVWMGAIAGFALSLAFSVAIAINVRLGRRPECHCFGQVLSRPVGWGTFARSSVLVVLAALLAWHAQTHTEYSLSTIVKGFSAAQSIGAIFGLFVLIAIGALLWLVLQLFRQNGRLLLRVEALEAGQQVAQRQVPNRPILHGLPVGAQAISFDLPILDGGRATLEGFLRKGNPMLLITTDPNCGPCNTLMPDVAAWQKALAEELTIVVLSRGRLADNRTKAKEHGLSNVLVAPDQKVAEKYQALGTPTGVLIRSDGTIGSPAMGGPDAIRQLVNHKAWTDTGYKGFLGSLGQPPAPPPPPSVLPVGSPAPAFTLPDLNGTPVSAASFNGSGTVLMFWNPSCGFCQRMLPQVKEWEHRKPAHAPRLVLVSSGTQEANRSMELKSTVLLDDRFAVGQIYGSRGTPSGVLLNSKGQVASALAVGEPNVMRLLSVEPVPAMGITSSN